MFSRKPFAILLCLYVTFALFINLQYHLPHLNIGSINLFARRKIFPRIMWWHPPNQTHSVPRPNSLQAPPAELAPKCLESCRKFLNMAAAQSTMFTNWLCQCTVWKQLTKRPLGMNTWTFLAALLSKDQVKFRFFKLNFCFWS